MSRSPSPAERRNRSRSPVAARRSNSRSRSPARENRGRSREEEAQDGNKLFIGNIGFDTTERDLEDMCGKYGKVVEARLAIDRSINKPKGFAFVTMETAADAEKCVEELAGKEIEGRPITVQVSHGKGGRRREGGDGSAMDDARATGACFDWVKGSCSRGDSCRFKHIGAGGGSGGRGRDRDYDRRDRYDDRRGGRDRDSGRDRDRDYDRRDRDSDRRDRGGSRDYGRDRDRDYDRRDRSRSRDRDRRR